jgi:hypothetical protein
MLGITTFDYLQKLRLKYGILSVYNSAILYY